MACHHICHQSHRQGSRPNEVTDGFNANHKRHQNGGFTFNPTSRSQSLLLIWTLKKDYAIIPEVFSSFIQSQWVLRLHICINCKEKLHLFSCRPNQTAELIQILVFCQDLFIKSELITFIKCVTNTNKGGLLISLMRIWILARWPEIEITEKNNT